MGTSRGLSHSNERRAPLSTQINGIYELFESRAAPKQFGRNCENRRTAHQNKPSEEVSQLKCLQNTLRSISRQQRTFRVPTSTGNRTDHSAFPASRRCPVCKDPRIWYSKGTNGNPQHQMSRSDVIEFVHYLDSLKRTGHTPLTWNGLGFDYEIVAEESGLWDQ